MKNFLA